LLVTVALALLLYAGAQLVRDRAIASRTSDDPRDDRALVLSPKAARVASLGYDELAADVAWAYTLIYYGDGMQRKTALGHVDKLLELVNTLDPRFRRPYHWGGYATTFRQGGPTQDEYRASIAVLERGAEEFPDDWEMAWLLGTRYFLDLKGRDEAETQRFKELGAAWIERAMRLPDAPSDLPLLAASMRTKLGQRERALGQLREMMLTTTDEKVRKQLEERYAELASSDASQAIAEAAAEFQAAWQAAMPYAPASLFVLVGEPPRAVLTLEDIARGDVFDAAPVESDPVFP
jgi:hypothetical protein